MFNHVLVLLRGRERPRQGAQKGARKGARKGLPTCLLARSREGQRFAHEVDPGKRNLAGNPCLNPRFRDATAFKGWPHFGTCFASRGHLSSATEAWWPRR